MTDHAELRRLAEHGNKTGHGVLLRDRELLDLLDERDELRELLMRDTQMRCDAEMHRDAARADLAAANALLEFESASKEREADSTVVYKARAERAEAENAALRERITELEAEVNEFQAEVTGYVFESVPLIAGQRDEAESERDRLQARIDKALALCASWEHEAAHWTDHAESVAGDKRAKSYALASKYRDASDQLRAALSDTAGPEDKP